MLQSIEYFTIPELGEDRPMFRCERRSATLQVSACSQMWRDANHRECPERLDRCRGCQVGAAHSGEGDISTCPITGTDICTRCHRGGMRLVRDEICVSCWNRERECLIGRNAKGSAPKMHPPLHAGSITVMAGDEIKVFSTPHCCSTTELMIRALRDCRKRVLFSFAGARP